MTCAHRVHQELRHYNNVVKDKGMTESSFHQQLAKRVPSADAVNSLQAGYYNDCT